MKKKDKYIKIFTIIVIIVSLIASFWTGVLVLFWPSWNIKIKENQNNIPKAYNNTIWNENLTGWDTTWSSNSWWTTVSTGSK